MAVVLANNDELSGVGNESSHNAPLASKPAHQTSEPEVQLPVAVCGFALGVTGFFGLVFFTTTQLLDWNYHSPAGLACVAVEAGIVFAILLAYISVGLLYGGLRSDLKDPTKRSLISAGAMAIINIGASICSIWADDPILHHRILAQRIGLPIFYFGAALHVVLQPLTLRQLLRCPSAAEMRIVWVVPLVGIGLVTQPDCVMLTEICVALAIFYYILLGPLVLRSALSRYRTLQGAAATAELPHICILLAPAGLALNGWLSVFGPLLPRSLVLLGAIYFMLWLLAGLLVVLWHSSDLRKLPVSPSAAAYTFPFQIAGTATLRWLTTGLNGIPQDLTTVERTCAWLIFVAAALPSVFALLDYMVLIFSGKLLVRRPVCHISKV